MTVSQIRSYMAEKIIPESVMPQNISVCLLDEEDRVIPELDAFTFLNRVRALGIGSADFLYLLKGCGAPEEAIEKIENNPAMNLQNLIVTLDSSGLTSQDYTRMLYTARQVWERTLTMRMDKKQLDKFREDHDPATVLLDASDLPTELIAQSPQEDDEFEDDPVTELLPTGAYSADEEYGEDDEDDDPPTQLLSASQTTDEDDEPLSEFIGRQLADIEQPEVLTARQLPHNEEDIAENEDDEPQREVLTARQKPKKEYIGRSDYDEFYDENKPVARHNGKIAASAVGAALLIGLNAAMYVFGFAQTTELPPAAVYATDNTEVFNGIYSSYTGGKLGAQDVTAYSNDRSEVFGSMLIQQPAELGVYSVGSRAFAVEPDLITVYEAADGQAFEAFTIQPPDGAEFIEIAESADRLTAVYMSENAAGMIAYNADGQTLYSAEQCGVLTDVYIYMDEISLGTVYTPPFTQSFTLEQTEHYLPQFTLDGTLSVMLPTEVMLTRSEGCSYAVHGSYSLADGSLKERTAALGDPVFSGAEEFFAVMREDIGFTLLGKGTQEQPIITAQTGDILACDIGDTFVTELSDDAEPYGSTLQVKREQALTATAETDEAGTVVYLRGFDYRPVSAITNIKGEVSALKIRGGILYILDKNGVLMAADISQPDKPVILELTASQGIVDGDTALCSSVSGSMVKLTAYSRDEQTVTEAGSTSRIVTLADGKSVAMCGGNTLFLGKEQYGAAFSYFDGVSRISEYALFGRTKITHSMFDKGDFICAAELDGALYLIYENGSIQVN